ncbi:MAG TPA: tRNA pseudouridine(38-40) synthase TruA [Solirubrobacterales bacterium]|nr:tRNA pseudouridine(38-40) synthase TruA [Solirubrobacterales bacterium]
MATYRLDLAYDGAGFRGWATQPGLRTVQGELEDALGRVLGEPVRLTVAGRTDAGVHALEQVASWSSERRPPDGLERALNALTGPDLAVLGITIAPGFDARRDARSRRYRYRIETGTPPSPFERGRALHWPHRLHRAALDECAALLAGTHDFTAFTPTETDHVRFERDVLAAGWEEEREGILTFEIEADAFLRSMVRALVGTMLEVGGGGRDVDGFRRLLAGAPRSDAGPTAPPEGLYLVAVRY